MDAINADVLESLAERFPESEKLIRDELEALLKADMRTMILKEKRRIDGRALDAVRDVTCENTVLPRTHGSALFTRGQTQALCVATLGTKLDERMADDLQGKRLSLITWITTFLRIRSVKCVLSAVRGVGTSAMDI